MKRNTLVKSSILGIGVGIVALSNASALAYDVTPEVIFGSGNANGAFTVDQSNGVELGLRAKLRHNAAGAPENTFNSNGDGTYSFATGVAPTQSSPTAVWSFEWSINSDFAGSTGTNLNDLSYSLQYDSDRSQGTSFEGFDPINLPNADHAIGSNATGNGGGAVAAGERQYATLIDGNNVAQNSWKPSWFLSSFDPTLDGTYDFTLTAYDATGGPVAATSMQVIVGQGGAPVPDGGSVFVLFGGALLGLAGYRRFSARR